MVFFEIPNVPKGTVFAEKVTYIYIYIYTIKNHDFKKGSIRRD